MEERRKGVYNIHNSALALPNPQKRWWTIADSGSWRSPCCPCRARPFATALMTLASPCTRTTPPSTESSRVHTPPPCSRPGVSCQSHSPERTFFWHSDLHPPQSQGPSGQEEDTLRTRRYAPFPPPTRLYGHHEPLLGQPTNPLPPTDIEGHWGADGKLYLLDFSRLYPPESIQQTQALFPTNPMASRALFYKMLRPGTTLSHERAKYSKLCSLLVFSDLTQSPISQSWCRPTRSRSAAMPSHFG